MKYAPRDGSNACTVLTFTPFEKLFKLSSLVSLLQNGDYCHWFLGFQGLEPLQFYGVRLIHLNLDLGSLSHFPK